MFDKLYPLKMKPVYKEMLWGGDRLKTLYNKDIPSDITGEAWELSCHKNGTSIVDNGELKGMPLSEVIAKNPGMLGKYSELQVLFKLIDAKDQLSVQVHPNDAQSAELEGSKGKTECWYVLHAEPGAKLVYGLKDGVTGDMLKSAIDGGEVVGLLNFVEVSAGDVYFIPAGCVHAIGAGIVIAELQQNSDITYRLYDFDRRDAKGNLRELHIEKSLKVINYINYVTPPSKPVEVGVLAECQFFKLSVCESETEVSLDPKEFAALFFLEGEGRIIYNGFKETAKKGDTFLIPHGGFTVRGNVKFLICE